VAVGPDVVSVAAPISFQGLYYIKGPISRGHALTNEELKWLRILD